MFSTHSNQKDPLIAGALSQQILIIDDDPNIVQVIEQALKYKGYCTRSATESEEGLRLFKEEGEFDVVITDLMMPGVSGIELLERIKKTDPNCEVLVLTGFGANDTAVEALKKGAYDYLKKPTNIDELFIAVAKAIEKKKLTLRSLNYQMDLERRVEERSSELLRTQKFLHSVLESSTEYFIIATDAKGQITLYNSGAERLFGYDRTEVEGKKPILFLSGLSKNDQPEDLDDFLKDGMIDQAQTIVNRQNREIPITLTVTPIKNEDEQTTGYIWIGKDITERLAMQAKLQEYAQNLERRVEERTSELMDRNITLEKTLQQLKEAQVQLFQAEKMASLGQLSAGVAHEINNPIGFVNSNLCTLKKYVQSIHDYSYGVDRVLAGGDQSATEDLARLKRVKKIDFILEDVASVIEESLEGTERVKSIVQDLKSFSYQDREDLVPYDLNKGIKSTLNIVWNELKYKVEVVEELNDLPMVHCFPQQINQVVLNLLVNAAQAIQERGKIVVHTDVKEDEVIIEVSDTGSGISPEHLPRIFEPFFTTKELGKGTGLGLSISYRIIEKHGGSIEVQSEVGVGTTFTIHLPVGGPVSESAVEVTEAVEAI